MATSAATLIDDVAQAASAAFNDACQRGKDVGSVIDGLSSPRIDARGVVGGELSPLEIAKLRGGLGSTVVADGSSEEQSAAVAGACEELNADTSTLPPTCACGCGAIPAHAKKTDTRTGARKGAYQRFVRGHARRGRHGLAFGDIDAAWLDAHVDKTNPHGHWIAEPVQVSIAGRRVYTSRLALLVHLGRAVTPPALAALQIRGRCHHHQCVNPAHAVALHQSSSSSEEEVRRRTLALEAGARRMAALRAGT